MNGNEGVPQRAADQRGPAPPGPPPDDEISLYDLWAVLERRWYVVVGAAFTVFLLGLVYAATRETTYTYRSAVDIGTLETEDGEERLIQQPQTVRSRFEDSTIPSVQARMAENVENVPDVEVGGGGQGEQASNVIVLSSTAPTRRSDVVEKLHKRVLDRLTATHAGLTDARRRELKRQRASLKDGLALIQDERVIQARRGDRRRAIDAAKDTVASLKVERKETILGLEAEIATAERQLDSLKARRERTKAEIARLDEREEVLQQRIETARAILSNLRTSRRTLTNRENQASVLGLFLGSSEIESAQKRLDRLVDELRFGIPERRDKLETRLDELQNKRANVKDDLEQKSTQRSEVEARYERKIAAQRRTISKESAALERMKAEHINKVEEKKREIAATTDRIEQLEPTSVSFASLKSLEPAGTSSKLIAALAAILGGMLGVFGAFFWEFASNARRYARDVNKR